MYRINVNLNKAMGGGRGSGCARAIRYYITFTHIPYGVPNDKR